MTRLLLLVILTLTPVLPDAEDQTAQAPPDEDRYAGNACVQCHRQSGGRLAEIVDLEWAKSVHFDKNVACQDCHGGDATLTRDQVSSDQEFKESSHASFNVEFLYLQDRKEIGSGMAGEPGLSYVCKECHGETIETGPGNPHEGPEGRPCLFSRDGGVSAARGRGIAYVCASCHTEATEKHLGSPHGSLGAPSCIFCHGGGTHTIPPVSIDILDTRPREELGRCSPCHKPSTMNVVAQIRQTLEQTAELIEVATKQFQELQQMGYRNLALGEMHAHIDDAVSSLRHVVHGSNIREINELARSIKHVAKHTAYAHELVQALRDARQRQTRIALGAAGLLLVLAVMLALYKRAFCRHSDE